MGKQPDVLLPQGPRATPQMGGLGCAAGGVQLSILGTASGEPRVEGTRLLPQEAARPLVGNAKGMSGAGEPSNHSFYFSNIHVT